MFKPNTGNPNMYADWFPIQIPKSVVIFFITFLLNITILFHSYFIFRNTSTQTHQEINLNGKRGILNRASVEETIQDKNKFKKSVRSKNIRGFSPLNRFRTPILEMHTIDTSDLLENGKLTSVKSKCKLLNCPTDTILYSIVEGNGELIMFGGIQREIINYDDGTEEREVKIIDTLHIIRAKREII